jgi:hypothetical protein
MERNTEKADVELQIEKRYKKTPTLRIAQNELTDYWHGSRVVKLQLSADAPGRDGYSIVVGEDNITLRSASDRGLLYGAYALLRMQETGNLPSVGQTVNESPSYDVRILKDGWTTVTADGKLSAHYENTVLITDGEPEILTVTEGL